MQVSSTPIAPQALPIQMLGVLAEARRTPPTDLGSAQTILDRMTRLLDAAGYAIEAPVPPAGKAVLPAWKERRLKAFIETELHRDLRLPVLAKVAGLSTSYLTRAFRNSFGMSPRTYVVAKRVERARALMVETATPLCEVAVMCGFADQAHMTRVFKDHMGASPARWRRVHRLILQ